MDPWWEFVLAHEKRLKKLCASQCRGRTDVIDELWCDVVVGRAEAIYKTYNPEHESGASLTSHMITNMRFYMFKWITSMGRPYSNRHQQRLPEDYDREGVQRDELELKDWVNTIMERLSEYDRSILHMYHYQDMTFKEIAAVLGYRAKGTARSRYLDAMERARAISDSL